MSRKKKNKSGKSGFDLLTMIVSVLFAIAWAYIGEILYAALIDVMWSPLVIGLYFMGLAVMQIIAIQVAGLIRGNAADGRHMKKAVVYIPVVLVAALALNFIYGIGISRKADEPTSFIFLIDDSGSMDTNDPQNMRKEAINQVMSNCDGDFPCAVYSFTDDAVMLMPTTPASEARSANFTLESWGTTDLMESIDDVLRDIESGALTGVGKSPRIVVLSDGESTQTDIRGVISRVNDKNISICTIEFGGSSSMVLQRLSEGTSGISINVDDASGLYAALQTAVNAKSEYTHNLINHRPVMHLDWLYFAMRIVFISIIGMLFLLIKAQLLRTNVESANTIVIHIVLLIISAVFVEFGMNIIVLPEILARGVMAIIFLLVITYHESGSRSGGSSTPVDYYGGQNYVSDLNPGGPSFGGPSYGGDSFGDSSFGGTGNNDFGF